MHILFVHMAVSSLPLVSRGLKKKAPFKKKSSPTTIFKIAQLLHHYQALSVA